MDLVLLTDKNAIRWGPCWPFSFDLSKGLWITGPLEDDDNEVCVYHVEGPKTLLMGIPVWVHCSSQSLKFMNPWTMPMKFLTKMKVPAFEPPSNHNIEFYHKQALFPPSSRNCYSIFGTMLRTVLVTRYRPQLWRPPLKRQEFLSATICWVFCYCSGSGDSLYSQTMDKLQSYSCRIKGIPGLHAQTIARRKDSLFSNALFPCGGTLLHRLDHLLLVFAFWLCNDDKSEGHFLCVRSTRSVLVILINSGTPVLFYKPWLTLLFTAQALNSTSIIL